MAEAAHMEVRHRGLITVSIMLAMIIVVLDMTIANIALPSMQSSLGAAQDTISWVLTSYIVAQAIATPVTGWLADRLGRRQLFLICVGGFIAASALCGSAQNLEQMVLYRVLQGAFGAAMAPLSQSVLLDINPREKHGSAMAMWGAGIMIGPILGPTLGGWLTESFNWRWVFYINLPLGLLAFLGIWFFMPETPIRKRRFDLFGFAMLSLAVGALQLLLDRGEGQDWFNSAEIWVEAGIVAAAVWVFVIHMATAKEPFITPSLFRDRNFLTGLFFIFTISTILFSGMALLPPMLEHLYGYPTILTGMVLAPRGVGTMVAMLIVGRLSGKVDARLLIVFGLSLTTISLWDMTGFALQMGMMPIIVTGVIQGFGLGFVFIPLSTLAFSTLAPRMRTEGTSMFSLIRNLGSSIGISVMVMLLSRNTTLNQAELSTRITPFSDIPAGGALDPAALAAGDPASTAMLASEIGRQAAMIAYLDDYKLMMIITLAAMPLLLFLRKPKRPPSAPAQDAATAAAME